MASRAGFGWATRGRSGICSKACLLSWKCGSRCCFAGRWIFAPFSSVFLQDLSVFGSICEMVPTWYCSVLTPGDGQVIISVCFLPGFESSGFRAWGYSFCLIWTEKTKVNSRWLCHVFILRSKMAFRCRHLSFWQVLLLLWDLVHHGLLPDQSLSCLVTVDQSFNDGLSVFLETLILWTFSVHTDDEDSWPWKKMHWSKPRIICWQKIDCWQLLLQMMINCSCVIIWAKC